MVTLLQRCVTPSAVSKVSADLLADIDKETVDFQPTTTARSLNLPFCRPHSQSADQWLSRYCGGYGDQPFRPHNLSEVIEACLTLLANPETDIEELIRIVQAPDFPTAALIYGLHGVHEG